MSAFTLISTLLLIVIILSTSRILMAISTTDNQKTAQKSQLPGDKSKRTALITGCSQGGIGDALAQEFHKKGFRVFAAARNLAKVQHLKALGIEVIPLDVVDEGSIKDAVEAVKKATGGALDVLVNNAGGGYAMPLMDSELPKAQSLFNLNVLSIMTITQAFLPLLLSSQGTVINIGSVVGVCPLYWQALYNASKAAVASLSDTMRLELAPLGVKVIHVITGAVRSRFWENQMGLGEDKRLPQNSLYAPAKDEIEASMRWGKPQNEKMATESYAAAVVNNAMKKRPKKHIWIGGSTGIVWMVSTFLWRSSWDLSIALPRRFNASTIDKKLRTA